MAKLRSCPTCGQRVSIDAKACPGCGETKPSRNWAQRHPVLTIVVLVSLIGLWMRETPPVNGEGTCSGAVPVRWTGEH